jgi:formate/nitrite transporter
MDLKINSPAEIAAIWVDNGVKKAALPTLKMLVLGVFAGVFIAFGGTAFLTAMTTIGGTAGVNKLVGAALFPAGLMLVIYCGSELFTGNNLLVLACMDKKITMGQLLRNWGLVYLGNAIGSYLVAYLVFASGLFGSEEASKVIGTIAANKVGLGFTAAFTRGILCNMLVVLACWFQAASKDLVGKIFAIWFPITLFVFSGFEHSIANMFFIPLGQFLGADITVGGIWLKNILPVTLGNIVGGAGIVSIAYYFIYVRNTHVAKAPTGNQSKKKK